MLFSIDAYLEQVIAVTFGQDPGRMLQCHTHNYFYYVLESVVKILQ